MVRGLCSRSSMELMDSVGHIGERYHCLLEHALSFRSYYCIHLLSLPYLEKAISNHTMNTMKACVDQHLLCDTLENTGDECAKQF